MRKIRVTINELTLDTFDWKIIQKFNLKHFAFKQYRLYLYVPLTNDKYFF